MKLRLALIPLTMLATVSGCLCKHPRAGSLTGPVPPRTNQAPISAAVTTDSAGRSGAVAAQSVVRIICPSKNRAGTGFLHKSGRIVTAAHVVEGCTSTDFFLLTSSGVKVASTNVLADTVLDLAIISPSLELHVPSLPLGTDQGLAVGSQVSVWGYPAGYNGGMPLLTVGYLSGIDRIPTPVGLSPSRWVVNAAFNSGNSGGPMVRIEDGTVIGVVSSKLAPIPPRVESALEALSKTQAGAGYTSVEADGTKKELLEGQVVAEVLQYLRGQTQLVIGHAVTVDDLKGFLKKQGIEP
jgi:S1-C subfamily serine protease